MTNQTHAEWKKQGDLIARVRSLLTSGKDLDLKIEQIIFDKLTTAEAEAKADGKFRVCLIGGFSEGKTSIAAAWADLDRATMNISSQESTDEVTTYRVGGGEGFEIVDTPGLFGYGEKSDDSGQTQKYKDITEKYVAQAHLILWVMSSDNSIKDSHAKELNWLLRDLNLLSRTVFVLNKFDGQCDLEDPHDYQETLESKRKDVVKGLRALIRLTPDEESDLSLVAVASDSGRKGEEHWQSDKEAYNKLSRMPLLQDATKDKIEQKGNILRLKLQQTVLKDVVGGVLPDARKKATTAKEQSESLAKQSESLTKEAESIEQKSTEIKNSIPKFKQEFKSSVQNTINELITQTKTCTIANFNDFVKKEIGENDASVLKEKLDSEFRESVEGFEVDVKAYGIDTENNLKHREDINVIGRESILRDVDVLAKEISQNPAMTGNLLKALSVPVAISGAIATGATVLSAIVGTALGVWGIIKANRAKEEKARAEEELVDCKEKIESALKEYRDDCIKFIESDECSESFLSFVATFEKIVQNNRAEAERLSTESNRLKNWCKELEDWCAALEKCDADLKKIST